MTDYISREAALEGFESCNAGNPNWTPQRVKTLLLRQPAADVAEVVHGEWMRADDDWNSLTTMRLIDANRLYDAAEEKYMEDRSKTDNVITRAMLSNARQRIQMLIAYAPSVDAIPVVRCKDCKYGSYDSKPNGAMVCLRTNNGFWRKETDFCSYGTPKNDGGET